jgi:hypothetical protein
MVSLTGTLVDEAHPDCQAIKSYPLGRALWEVVSDGHARLVGTQRVHPSLARLGEIRDELARLHQRHGEVVRGIYYTLQAQQELIRDAVLAAEVQRLHARMFPEHLMATRKSYRGLAGQAELLRTRLRAEDFEILGQLGMLGGGTMVDAVGEWFAIAGAMGELENERARGEGAPTGADVAAARSYWIRAVQAFMATLRLRDDVPAAVMSILDRIERVVRSAGPRRARRVAGDDVTSSDAMSADQAPGEQGSPVALHLQGSGAFINEDGASLFLARPTRNDHNDSRPEGNAMYRPLITTLSDHDVLARRDT